MRKTEASKRPSCGTRRRRCGWWGSTATASRRLSERDFAPYLDALRADVTEYLTSPDDDDVDDDDDDDDDGRIPPGPITTSVPESTVTGKPRTMLCADLAAAVDDALERADATRRCPGVYNRGILGGDG